MTIDTKLRDRISRPVVIIYWLAVFGGLALYSTHSAQPTMSLWIGAILGTVLGQAMALLNLRTWFVVSSIFGVLFCCLPLFAFGVNDDEFWMAMIPAILCGYWSLGDRSGLASFWFPTVLWMLSILDRTSALAPDGLAGMLMVVLVALFVVFLRARESRRATLWATVGTEPLGERTGVPSIERERAGSSIARGGWTVAAAAIACGITAFVAPRLWKLEQLSGGAAQHRPNHEGEGIAGSPDALMCCPVEDGMVERVPEYFDLGRGHPYPTIGVDCRMCPTIPMSYDYDGDPIASSWNGYYGRGRLAKAWDDAYAEGYALGQSLGGRSYGELITEQQALNDQALEVERIQSQLASATTSVERSALQTSLEANRLTDAQIARQQELARQLADYQQRMQDLEQERLSAERQQEQIAAALTKPELPQTLPPQLPPPTPTATEEPAPQVQPDAAQAPEPTPPAPTAPTATATNVQPDHAVANARPAYAPPPRAPSGKWFIAMLFGAVMFQLVRIALRPLRRAVTLRHLRRPYWEETVDQRISNSWQLALVGLRDAGWRASANEAPREFAKRTSVDGVAQCATIVERARHGIGLDSGDLAEMSANAETAYRNARGKLGAWPRMLAWLRYPLT